VRAELANAIPNNPRQSTEEQPRSEGSQIHQLLTVRIGEELFGVTLERIERILSSVRLTPLPVTATHFDGMADIGESVVPVIDLRSQVSRLEAPTKEALVPCILTMLEGALAGILIDQVLTIRDVPSDKFEPVKDGSKLPVSHVVSLDGRLISVLTLDRLLPAA
jgi:purine-binding chemotaxis protein CheW